MTGDIKEYSLPDVIRTKKSKQRALALNTNSRPIDKVDEERQKAYLKLVALRNLWNQVHDRAIQPALKASLLQLVSEEQVASDLTDKIDLKQLVDLIGAFDSEVRHLGDVSHDHKRTTDLLEGLLDMIVDEIKFNNLDMQITSDARRKRRKRIRDQSHKIIRAMNSMEKKIATPGWLRRIWVALMGGQKLEISPDLHDRLSTMVGSSLRNTSRTFAGYANMPDEVVEAFGVLDLHAWSTQQEMRQRYKYLIKAHHPDLENGSAEMVKKFTNARNILDRHFTASE